MRNTARSLCTLLVICAIACTENGTSKAVAERDICLKEGGDWRRVCIAQLYQCVKPYKDGGKICADSSECIGECIFDLTTHCDEAERCDDLTIPQPGDEVMGVCQYDDDPCGSFVIIRQGRAQPIIHRD